MLFQAGCERGKESCDRRPSKTFPHYQRVKFLHNLASRYEMAAILEGIRVWTGQSSSKYGLPP